MWPSSDTNKSPITNTRHQHAFTMAGSENLFLCHMPMLDMEDHMYQMVLHARLPDDAMQHYRNLYDKQDRSNTFFLVNQGQKEAMSLLELATGRKKSFLADIWDKATVRPGQKIPPWKDIAPIIMAVRVEVERVVYFRHIDLNFNRPRFLTYVLFGRGQEAHLYHYLSGQPDFDHVVTLDEVPDWLPADEGSKDGYRPQLEAGIHVNFPELPDTPLNFFRLSATSQGPLKPDSTHSVQYYGMDHVVQHSHQKKKYVEVKVPEFPVAIGRNLWFNTSIGNTRDPSVLPLPDPPESPMDPKVPGGGHDH